MRFEFGKLQATGNDFIVTKTDNFNPELFETEQIKKLCDRHFGIGADGFIIIEKIEGFAFRFHYYNSDGSRGEMCANGCRAAISFAKDCGWVEVKSKFFFMADDGEHYGVYHSGNKIEVNILVNGKAGKINLSLYELPGWIKEGFFIDTGVPHVVLICRPGLKQKTIDQLGGFIRAHENFAPSGTNVNFMEILSDNTVFVRTFERGVEKETLSCGTGNTASAIIARKLEKKHVDKIKVLSKGGEIDVLTSNEAIHIIGPAKKVFNGLAEI